MKTFHLEITTPERRFYDGPVESLVVEGTQGKLGILAGHIPMSTGISVGTIRFKVDGSWKESFCSEGFLEVRPDRTIILAQAVEWPDEIDARRAEEARLRAEERLRQRKSMQEYTQSKIALTRAMVRLRVTRNRMDKLD